MTKKLSITLLLLAVSIPTFSQHAIKGSAGLNYTFVGGGPDAVVYDSWKMGVNLGVTARIALIDEITIRPGVSYQYLLFDTFHQFVYAGAKAVSSTGTGSGVMRLSGEVHLGDCEDGQTRFSFSLGGGYALERPGTMTITWADFEGDRNLYTTQHQLRHRDYWYGSVGIDCEFPIAADLAIGTSLRFYGSRPKYNTYYTDDNTLLMLNCSIVYDLINF
jgi:hypothetical protein